MRKQKRGAAYWEQTIQEFLKSGVTQKAFIEQRWLCRAILSDWSKRLRIPLSDRSRTSKIKQQEAPLTFLEVSSSKDFSFSPPLPSTSSTLSAVKCEVSFHKGDILKLEGGATWSQVGEFLRTLVG